MSELSIVLVRSVLLYSLLRVWWPILSILAAHRLIALIWRQISSLLEQYEVLMSLKLIQLKIGSNCQERATEAKKSLGESIHTSKHKWTNSITKNKT